jgi:hypothetical protein
MWAWSICCCCCMQDPWVSAAVLVETFQPGVSVEQFIRRPAPFNTQVLAASFLMHHVVSQGTGFRMGCRPMQAA